ncbi:YhgE/Pip domain-containing protein [Alkalicoccus luteus]|uniref:YhgE/Pip domain-containing protein n=1 Tax=Alkalicoccus luteus TaxID=1237094 RepID=A0A969TUY4_9BACI|nr:YhgE/Pip domain-containing protein [Alkalicoccus luteus]NJP37552.1 YhgE/Pip domain-containing protein [Alkalicoccus luteus]
MKHAKQIMIQDFKNIKRVPLVGILLIGLAVLPALYAWFNLGAAWDPYSNTGDVSIAVVNEDEGAEYEGEPIHIGRELTEELQKNDDLDWQFMSRQEAHDQVRRGDVYASVYLDSTFSEETVRVFEEGDTNAAVRYEVNEKINAIAPTMTETGATTITQQINDSFVEASSAALLEEFDRLGLRLEDELPTLRVMADTVYDMEEALPELRELAEVLITIDDDWENVEDVASTFLELENIGPEVEQAFSQLYYLEEQLPRLYEAADTAEEAKAMLPQLERVIQSMERIDSRLPQAEEELQAASQNVSGLETVIESGNALVPELEAELAAAEETLHELEIRASLLEQQAESVQQSSVTILSGVGSLLEQALETSADVDDQLAALEALELDVLPEEAAALAEEAIALLEDVQAAGEWTEEKRAEAENLIQDIENVSIPLPELEPDLSGNALTERLDELEAVIQQTADSLREAEEENEQPFLTALADEAEQTLESFKESRASLPQEEDLEQAVLEAVDVLEKQAEQLLIVPEQALADFMQVASSGSAAEVVQRAEETERILEDTIRWLEETDGASFGPLEEAKASLQAVQQAGDDAAERANEELDRIQEAERFAAEEAPGQIAAGFENVRGALDQEDRFREAEDYLEQAVIGLSTAEDVVETAGSALTTAEEEFPAAAESWGQATQTAADAYPEIEQAVSEFASFLSVQLPVVEERIDRMIRFVEEDWPEIEDGYAHAASLLETNMPKVEETIGEAAALAREDFPEAEDGLTEAAERLRALEENETVQEMIDALRNDLYEQAELLANPVSMEEESLFPIPNYGSANAPFYTALSLWVGALLLVNLVSTNLHGPDRRPEYSERDIYLGRMGIFLITAVLQGLVVSIGNMTILGMYSAHSIWFTVFSVLIAVIFMLMVYTLASMLGNIGKALAIVLLVLQLSGGGGTFPIEVTPSFFQTIHPFLPFTYAIDLLREAVGGIVWSAAGFSLIILAGCGILTVGVGLLLKPKLAKRIQATTDKSKASRMID